MAVMLTLASIEEVTITMPTTTRAIVTTTMRRIATTTFRFVPYSNMIRDDMFYEMYPVKY